MNGHNFTLIKAKDRTLDFHTHQDSDEVFFIVEGQMKLEFSAKQKPTPYGRGPVGLAMPVPDGNGLKGRLPAILAMSCCRNVITRREQ
jgi:hypothetical protein